MNIYFNNFFLLVINSERVSMYAPNFVSKISKTRELQFQALIETFKNYIPPKN